MRDLRLQAIDYKIARIRFYKTIGKVVFLMALITVLALVFIRLDFILKCQTDTLNQIMDLRQEIDEVKESIDNADKVAARRQNTANTTSIGEYTITHYCLEEYPHICNDGESSHTASGQAPVAYYTAAADKSIPFGTMLVIDGVEYEVMDRGGDITKKRLDIAVPTHDIAIQMGVIKREVFTVDQPQIY